MVPKRTIKLREANIVNVSKTQKDKKAYNSDPHLHSEKVQGGSSYSLFTYKCHKSNIKNLLMKSSDIVFIFLPAFYLVIWLMTSPKNFEKMSILKI